MESNSINRHGNPNVTRGYFGGKSHCHPRLVKRRQLRSQLRRKWKAKIVSVSVLSRVLIVMSTNLEHIQKEKDRKRESRRQASEAQREKERQRARARDKKQRRHFLLEEQYEKEKEVPAATKVKMSGSEKKK